MRLLFLYFVLISGCATRTDPLSVHQHYVAAATFIGEYYQLEEVDRMPGPISNVLRYIDYPNDWVTSGEPYALVAFIIDTEGWPQQVQCTEATDERFAELAVGYMKNQRYRPALMGTSIVPCLVEGYRVSFNPFGMIR